MLVFKANRALHVNLHIQRSKHPEGGFGWLPASQFRFHDQSWSLFFSLIWWKWPNNTLFPPKDPNGGYLRKGKGKGSGVWPSMVTHTRNLSSAFNPSKCTLTAVNTHLEQWAAILRRPGAVGGSVPCSRVSPQSWYWRWGEHLFSLPPPTIPAGPGNRTGNLWVTSPTL